MDKVKPKKFNLSAHLITNVYVVILEQQNYTDIIEQEIAEGKYIK